MWEGRRRKSFPYPDWFHNCMLLDKVKDPEERLWYIQQTIQHGWSRSILTQRVESGLYRRQGEGALTNFNQTLPQPQTDLAQQILRDPYNFDFLSLGSEAQERELETALIRHIREFSLEMGVGFAILDAVQAVGASVSIGVATLSALPFVQPETLVESADQALYVTKRQGKNRFIVAEV
ncbi:PDDEXK nuclease domain-containing protein [Leptolyngbya sp. FACHB-541]|uniref:PDDEXK nuclease domain-containing protein n=1 Tax=Leptolyngbya sp. FACHB-541 TaxID=2692810 RepID=UPI003220459A